MESSCLVLFDKHRVEVSVPNEGQFEDTRLEVFVGDGALLEDGKNAGSCFLESSIALFLCCAREVPGWREGDFCLSSFGFAVFSLCGGTNGILLIDRLFFDVAEFEDAFRTSSCVDEVKVRAIVKRLEHAGRRDVRICTRSAELFFVQVDAGLLSVGGVTDASPLLGSEELIE